MRHSEAPIEAGLEAPIEAGLETPIEAGLETPVIRTTFRGDGVKVEVDGDGGVLEGMDWVDIGEILGLRL